jgi:hypothetical protein
VFLNTVSVAIGAFLLAAGSAQAITVSGLNPNSGSYTVSLDSVGSDYSGVAQLTIIRSHLGISNCSGSLLSDGYSILTAAHCIADLNGKDEATATYVTFNSSSTGYEAQVAKFQVDPLYDGTAESPHDAAVLTLGTEAPSSVARYNLYQGDAANQKMILAGYGLGGTGITGYDGLDYPIGTLRLGENEYDGGSGTQVGDDDLIFDFDDGTLARDALGDLGLGAAEAFVAPGDSGGPSFIDGKIAGIHSFLSRDLAGGSTDIDGLLNSSFGEYAGDVSVGANSVFIQSLLVASPEPSTLFLIGIALVAVSLLADKTRPR